MRGYLTNKELFCSAYVCNFLVPDLQSMRHRSRALHPMPDFALNTIKGRMVCTYGTHA